jgi:hypothetical protein
MSAQYQCTKLHQTYTVGLKNIEPNTMIVGEFNTPLMSIDMSFRQKNQQKKLELNDTIHKWT